MPTNDNQSTTIQHFFKINGKRTPVTDAVYRADQHPAWAKRKCKESEKCRVISKDSNGTCIDYSSKCGQKKLQINYRTADGKIIELEVSEEVGAFYLESRDAEKKNDRKNSRPDRHSQLSTFEYEDIRYFSDGADLLADLIESEALRHAMACLNERQQYLIRKCFLEGWSYTDLARLEGKDEAAIRHAVDRVKKKLKKFLE